MATGERVLWAIDPYEKASKPDRSMIQKLLKGLIPSHLELQPVYVAPLPNQGIDDYIAHGDSASFITDTEQICERYLRSLEVKGTHPTKVIVSGSTSKSEAIQNLFDYADELKSPWIMVSTHGRSGIQRLVLGSFAEKLIHLSPVPVLILTHQKPADQPEAPLKRVVFPTDFSDHSRHAFLQFLKQSKRFGFELILFHNIPVLAEALTNNYPAPMVNPDNYFRNQEKWAREEGARWAELAQSDGVPATFHINDQRTAFHIGKSILEIAQLQRADLIAMASSSGAFTSFVTGSVARDVIRANQYPVWVYGPKFLRVSLPVDFARVG